MKNKTKDTVNLATYKESVIGCYYTCLMIEERDETQDEFIKSKEVDDKIRELYESGMNAYDAVAIIEDMY